MQYPELPVVAFLAAFLVLIPLPWHWRAGNIAILALIFWLFITDVIYGVNAIVWAGNVGNPIPIWCDITTKFVAGASYALPLCTMCICKHLEMVSSSRKISYNVSDRRKRMIFEASACFLVPMIFMALHYIVQGHRYDIIENIGCQAAIYISIPAVFLIWFPQLLCSVITLIYAALALHNFIRRRLTFSAHLQNSNSALTTNRYLRLIAMALTEMSWGTTLTAYNLWNNVSVGLRPWTNWDDVHSNFSRVHVFPALFIPKEYIRIMMLFWWSIPASSFIFFAFFGFGEEAVKEYRKIWTWSKTVVLRKRSSEKKGTSLGRSTGSSRSTLRPLRLASIKWPSSTSSSSSEVEAKSPTSITSTIVISPKYKTEDKKGGCLLPSYYEPSSPTSTHPTLIGQQIDTKRNAGEHLTLPDIDESDAFTISSFSYYETPLPSANRPPSSSASNAPTGTAFVVVPPTPPHPPSPHFISPQHSLPPPPRKQPRAVGSISSLLSTATSMLSYPNANGSEARATSSSALDVPEDVSPSSYTQSEGVLHGLSERDELAGHEPLSNSQRVLGIAGGQIVVTVQRQASIDRMV